MGFLWGQAPQKVPTIFLKISDQSPMSKKSKMRIFIFGSKNCANRCILVSGVWENSFFDQKLILKFFDFRTSKNFKIF